MSTSIELQQYFISLDRLQLAKDHTQALLLKGIDRYGVLAFHEMIDTAIIDKLKEDRKI